MKIALITPNENTYSETFVNAHKNLMTGSVHYLYGGFYPVFCEKHGRLKNAWDILKIVANKVLESFDVKYRFKENSLKKYLKKNKINMVLAEYGPTAGEIVDICEGLKIPLITHFHGFDAYHFDTIREYGEKYKKVFEYSSKIISVSIDMTEQLVKLGAEREKIVYNPCGADESFLDISPDYNSDHCFFVGRFCDKKAPYFVLMAFQKACQQNNRLKLTMAGDGELREACINMAEQYRISDKVSFPGVVTPEQVKKYMKNSFCYLQHSIASITGDSEGTPVGVMEASAAGLPVIATRHAGIKDVIIESETGILVNEKDVDGMAEAIIKLAKDRALCKKMGANGKQIILNGFTAQQRVHLLNKLIEKIFEENH